MISSNNHQRTKDYFFVSCCRYSFDHFFACCLFRFAFNGSDKYIFITKLFHLSLHLAVRNFCCMRSSMSHKYKCNAIFFCCIQGIIICCCYCFRSDCFCYCFFIIVYSICIISDLTQQRFCYFYRFKFIFICIYGIHQFVILCTMHQMCRLNNQIFNAIIYGTFQSLIHVVDVLIITSLDVIDNDLCCECSSYRPVRICSLQCIFNTFDISNTAVIERSTKAYNQEFVFTDLITIARIIFGCITGISSEIIRISFFAFNQFFLSICQSIPCFFCFFTLLVCVLISFLNINCIDQSCYFICCCLIIFCFRSCCCFRSCLGCCRFGSCCCLGYCSCLCRSSCLCCFASASCQHRCCNCCYT